MVVLATLLDDGFIFAEIHSVYRAQNRTKTLAEFSDHIKMDYDVKELSSL